MEFIQSLKKFRFVFVWCMSQLLVAIMSCISLAGASVAVTVAKIISYIDLASSAAFDRQAIGPRRTLFLSID